MIGEPCETCGNKYPVCRQFLNEEKIWICDKCGSAPMVSFPDVFWDGKPEINLADDPATGRPRVFGSRMEKARYLQERGLRQDGDKHHGAFESVTVPRAPVDHRPEIRNILRQWKGMGRDRQKEEYRKIVLERGR